MTGPRPTFAHSRLNVGGYRGTLRGQLMVEKPGGWCETPSFPTDADPDDVGLFWLLTPHKVMGLTRIPVTVHPNGSLTIEPEAWAVRHYRRAVMGGAGVYRLGLWAFLAARRAHNTQAGAALVVPMNGAALLDGFTPWGQAPPLPLPPAAVLRAAQLTHRAPRERELTFRQIEARYGREVSAEALRASIRAGLELIPDTRSLLADLMRWIDPFAGRPRPRPQYTGTPESLARVIRAAREELAQLAAEHGAEPVAYAQAARHLRRALRRMVPRRALAPQTARIPRPLHTQPRPPAAPLAPPALA